MVRFPFFKSLSAAMDALPNEMNLDTDYIIYVLVDEDQIWPFSFVGRSRERVPLKNLDH